MVKSFIETNAVSKEHFDCEVKPDLQMMKEYFKITTHV